jgi:hypothetical protein
LPLLHLAEQLLPDVRRTELSFLPYADRYRAAL